MTTNPHQRKPIFFTSDWHIGHNAVIKLDNRPFRDVNDMANALVTRYNATVPANGLCYFLGDMGLCKPEELGRVISRLNGTKVLILGNHDKNAFAMYDIGFDVVMNAGVIYLGQYRISISHCPLPGIYREGADRGVKPGENWHGELKNHKFTSQDLTVDFHLHGHVHKQKDGDYKTDRQYDVGVAANNYTPVSFVTIESWMAQNRKL